MPDLPLEIRKLYKQLHMDVSTLHWRTSIVISLYKGNEQNVDVLRNAAPFLFHRVLPNDLYDSLVLNIARLLDPAQQGKFSNASLEKLINDIRPFDNDIAKKMGVHLENLRATLPSVEQWRNKWACHRDYDTMLALQTPTESALRPNFTVKHLEFAMLEMAAFLNLFEARFEDGAIVLPSGLDILNYKIPAPTDFTIFNAKAEVEQLLGRLQ